VDKEISLLEAYAAQGAQAVAIAPASVTASIPGLQAAHDAGLKVVTYDNFIKADFPVSNIQSDQINLGASMGRAVRAYVDKNLGGKAKLAMIEALAVSPEVCAQRVQGFKQGLGEASGIEIVAEQDAWMAPMAADVAESLMGANPEINLIWAANEGGTVGAVTAVRNSGKAGKVVVFGTDMSDQIGTFLGDADGVLIAVAGQRAFEIGGNAIKAAVAAVRGVEVEPAQKLPGIEFSRDAPEAIAQFRASLSAVHGDGAATTGGAAGAAGAGQ
jgi:ABC-type sugar transport system substrate-binding protein